MNISNIRSSINGQLIKGERKTIFGINEIEIEYITYPKEIPDPKIDLEVNQLVYYSFAEINLGNFVVWSYQQSRDADNVVSHVLILKDCNEELL